MKVDQLYEQTPNQLLNPTVTPKPAHQGSKKTKKDPKIMSMSNSNVGIQEIIENESCSST